MSGKICCFAGHRNIYNREKVYSILKSQIEYLILNKNVTEFLVGNYGTFDMLVAKCIRELKNNYKHIKLTLVIPYVTKEINEAREEYYKNYNDILIADIPLSTPPKYKILKCNNYMITQSDYLICYIEYSWGGASKTLEYAKKQNIKIFNINDIIKKYIQ